MQPSPSPIEAAEALVAAAPALVLCWARAEAGIEPQVPPSQLRALLALDRYGPLNLVGLAQELGALPSSASRLCDRLEAAGLLLRGVSEASRREIEVSLSRDGGALLDRLAASRRDQLSIVLAAMAPADRTALTSGLHAFAAAAEQTVELLDERR